jgi:hypothetical protein
MLLLLLALRIAFATVICRRSMRAVAQPVVPPGSMAKTAIDVELAMLAV